MKVFGAGWRTLLRQRREIVRLRRDVARLEAQNNSMRAGMRRCLSCEYRLDALQKRDGEPGQ